MMGTYSVNREMRITHKTTPVKRATSAVLGVNDPQYRRRPAGRVP